MNRLPMIISALPLLFVAGAAVADADNAEGRLVYETSCARCHDSGKMGAPMLDDMSEWTDRTAMLWSDVHLQHLDDGLLRSADKDAKKGITAEQMEAATNYMVSIVSKK